MFMGCLWVLSLITASCFRNPPWRAHFIELCNQRNIPLIFYKIFLVSWSDRHRKPVGSPRTAPNWLRLWHAHKFPKLPSLLEEVSAPAITACVEGLMTEISLDVAECTNIRHGREQAANVPCPNHSWIQTKKGLEVNKVKGVNVLYFVILVVRHWGGGVEEANFRKIH